MGKGKRQGAVPEKKRVVNTPTEKTEYEIRGHFRQKKGTTCKKKTQSRLIKKKTNTEKRILEKGRGGKKGYQIPTPTLLGERYESWAEETKSTAY